MDFDERARLDLSKQLHVQRACLFVNLGQGLQIDELEGVDLRFGQISVLAFRDLLCKAAFAKILVLANGPRIIDRLYDAFLLLRCDDVARASQSLRRLQQFFIEGRGLKFELLENRVHAHRQAAKVAVVKCYWVKVEHPST